MPILSQEQEGLYEEQGYLLVSGLIPAEIAAEAEAAMLRILEADPENAKARSFSPSAEDQFLLACCTSQVLEAAARLAGDPPETFRPPTRPYAINVFPGEGDWKWPRPHIDHAIKEHGHKTFPRAFRIAAMTYLSDVPLHGGGTVVWPGSHRKIEALARSDMEHYEMMWPLNQDIQKAGIGDPVELRPKRGDILFYHYLCAHAGSMNVSDRPRLALNMKW